MSENFENATGVVIGVNDRGEKDVVVLLFTDKFGKIEILAKGVKNIKAKFISKIQPGSFGVFRWVVGQGIPKLVSADSINPIFKMETIEAKKFAVIGLDLVKNLIPFNIQENNVLEMTLEYFSEIAKNDNDKNIIIESFISFAINLIFVLGWLGGDDKKIIAAMGAKDAIERIKNIITWHTGKNYNLAL